MFIDVGSHPWSRHCEVIDKETGEILKNVVSANDETGEVVQVVRTEDGDFEPRRDGIPVLERTITTRNIKIRPGRNAPAWVKEMFQ